MLPGILADFSWLSGDDLWWTVGMGAVFSVLVFLLGTRLLARQPAIEGPQRDSGDADVLASATKERRQAYRRKGSSVAVQIGEPNQTESAHTGWVMDRSVSGLGLWSEKKVPVGTQLKVRPESGPSMTPWVEVEVCSCKEHEAGWHLGCSFVKVPPYSVLLLFG